jgi:hypothetical protein
MATALPLLVTLFAPLQCAVQWLSGGSTPARSPRTAANDARSGDRDIGEHDIGKRDTVKRDTGKRHTAGSAAARVWQGPTRAAQRQPPLRVVRVVEPRACQAFAGRMVISGRMEDVCAELDRLAALETAC